MLSFLRSLLLFRVGQKTSKRVARMVGLSAISSVVGVVGGWRYMRRHS